MSGNRLLADLTEALRTVMKPTMLASLRAIEPAVDGVHPVLGRLCREHRGIYDAIAAGDGARAADAVEAHITGFYLQDGPAT
jgi:GntR family transcriptional repressor for pyruvate dehydrogenase complex